MTDEDAPLMLYVDDDPAVLNLDVAALEEGGFRVEAVQRTGADAVRQLERPDSAIRTLTDIDLSAGATG